ncbi:hypothetical protein DMUE_4444 [Dictyocoela muelleri]|nr:hypothetical protein DMUE_4444 [Dictyocoela muelleri]
MDWRNKGEIDSKNRPIDSLLSLETSFKRLSKETIIDEDSIDRLVKQRIRDKLFDNHEIIELNTNDIDDDYVVNGEIDPNINLYELYEEISADLDKICCVFRPKYLCIDKEIKKAKPKKSFSKKKQALGILKKSKNVEILNNNANKK